MLYFQMTPFVSFTSIWAFCFVRNGASQIGRLVSEDLLWYCFAFLSNFPTYAVRFLSWQFSSREGIPAIFKWIWNSWILGARRLRISLDICVRQVFHHQSTFVSILQCKWWLLPKSVDRLISMAMFISLNIISLRYPLSPSSICSHSCWLWRQVVEMYNLYLFLLAGDRHTLETIS